MSTNPSAGGADPSMEDILASIRRILSEDEAAAEAAPTPPPPPPSEVFALPPSMMVGEPTIPPSVTPAAAPVEPPPPAEPAPVPVPHLVAHRPDDTATHDDLPRLDLHEESPPMAASESAAPAWGASMVAPEAAAAAAQSVTSLRRTLEAGRASMLLRQGGPTLEDLVREELRPVLKAWLDTNLPPLVERLVRAEIERVVGHADL